MFPPPSAFLILTVALSRGREERLNIFFVFFRTKIEKEKRENAKQHGMIRTEITGAEIAEEMEKERRLFQLQMCEVAQAPVITVTVGAARRRASPGGRQQLELKEMSLVDERRL